MNTPPAQNHKKSHVKQQYHSATKEHIKIEEMTAEKNKNVTLSEDQKILIRNQLFSLFKQQALKGKIKVQDIQDLSQIEITFYHKIKNRIIQQNIRVTFPDNYPENPPNYQIHSCNLSQKYPQYVIPNFLSLNELNSEKWSPSYKIGQSLAKMMESIEDFHKSQMDRLIFEKQDEQFDEQIDSCQSLINQRNKEVQIPDQIVKNRRKSSNMTGCADKQLTETKNLNRHFRSKLRQVLRDLSSGVDQYREEYKLVDQIFTPNRVGFEDIRKALSNRWFNECVRRQMNSGQFLHKILRGMMGIKSKKLMIKYYHVMVSAVEQPSNFTRWKYD